VARTADFCGTHLAQLLTLLVDQAASQLTRLQEEESKGKKEEDFSANPSKKIHWKKIPFSTARFASIRFRPWQHSLDWHHFGFFAPHFR